MIKLTIEMTKCDLCNECVDSCTNNALKGVGGDFEFDYDNCAYCEVCMDVCHKGALTVEEV